MIFFGDSRSRTVSVASREEAEKSRLHGVAVRRGLGGVSCWGSVGSGGRSRVACRRVTVTGVGLLGGHWSSSRAGQHQLLACNVWEMSQ